MQCEIMIEMKMKMKMRGRRIRKGRKRKMCKIVPLLASPATIKTDCAFFERGCAKGIYL